VITPLVGPLARVMMAERCAAACQSLVWHWVGVC